MRPTSIPSTTARSAAHRRAGLRQRGVVLLFSLITLVVLLLAAVALIRSFSNSMFTAGNIAFRRDLPMTTTGKVIRRILRAEG